MLPDFPGIKRHLDQLLQQALANETKDPFLSRIPRQPVYEGRIVATGDVRGTIRNTELEQFTAEFSITLEELVNNGSTAYFARARMALAAQQSAIAKSFFSTLSQTTTEVGNSIDARGKPFSKELFLQVLETIEWDFHDDGTHNKESLMLVVSPEVGASLKAHAAQWENDPDLIEQMQVIEDQKRKEWRDRESHRRLVD